MTSTPQQEPLLDEYFSYSDVAGAGVKTEFLDVITAEEAASLVSTQASSIPRASTDQSIEPDRGYSYSVPYREPSLASCLWLCHVRIKPEGTIYTCVVYIDGKILHVV